MTVYIVDTNIVFSATLNAQGNIARLLLEGSPDIEFKAPTFLQSECAKHIDRLVALTGQSEESIQMSLHKFYDKIEFVPDHTIPIAHFARAYKLIGQIDSDDLSFVALSIYEGAYLLTGDKKLIKGLIDKGYQKVLTFQELKEKHNIT